ncbi:MAG TPA: Flp pilus assembly protein CpaB [Caulobacteraceae bacterium]|jgi:pilus assembly protein CpaB
MRTGTVVSLGASAVLGLGALIVARVWLPQPNHGREAKAAAPVATVPVVVATSAIPYGGKLDAAHIAVEQLPAGDAPQGAYSSTGQILKQQGGPPIALTPIAAREPLLPSKLSGGGARPTVSAVIDEGMRAFTIGIGDVAGVGGHILPGDRVDVILSRDIPQLNIPGQPTCNCKRVRADVVLQDVKVLGIDLNADPTTTQAAIGHTATLQVDVQSAQKLAVAAQVGTMSLALRRTGQADMTPVRTVEIRDLQWNGARAPGPAAPADDARILPVMRQGRLGPPGGSPQIVIHTHSVTVVHGDTSTQVQVPAERFGAGA